MQKERGKGKGIHTSIPKKHNGQKKKTKAMPTLFAVPSGRKINCKPLHTLRADSCTPRNNKSQNKLDLNLCYMWIKYVSCWGRKFQRENSWRRGGQNREQEKKRIDFFISLMHLSKAASFIIHKFLIILTNKESKEKKEKRECKTKTSATHVASAMSPFLPRDFSPWVLAITPVSAVSAPFEIATY